MTSDRDPADSLLRGGRLELVPGEVIERMSVGDLSAAALDGMAALLAELLAGECAPVAMLVDDASAGQR